MPFERHPDDVDADFAMEEAEEEARRAQAAPGHGGSEVEADADRKGGGPRYHGGGWEQAEQEPERETIERHMSPTRADADERVDDPGARGSTFGKGGAGLARRGDPEEDRDDVPVDSERRR